MGTIANNSSGGQQRHDGQKNYEHSNQRNRDNVRDNTRDHQYKDYDESLTNDANFESGTPKQPNEMDSNDTKENVDEGNHPQ